MSQYRKRVDENQKVIVAMLRDMGASVIPLHWVGRGFPDLAVGWKGLNYLFEVKNTSKKLTPKEAEFFKAWKGQAHVIESFDDAWRILSEEV